MAAVYDQAFPSNVFYETFPKEGTVPIVVPIDGALDRFHQEGDSVDIRPTHDVESGDLGFMPGGIAFIAATPIKKGKLGAVRITGVVLIDGSHGGVNAGHYVDLNTATKNKEDAGTQWTSGKTLGFSFDTVPQGKRFRLLLNARVTA